MTRAKKVNMSEISDQTLLKDVSGWGAQSFTVLGSNGYTLNRRSTVGDFKLSTKSLEDLRATLVASKSETKYVMPKFSALWRTQPTAGGGDGASNPITKSSLTSTNYARKRKAPEPSLSRQAMAQREDPSTNFLLQPRATPGQVDTSLDPENITSIEETPEVGSLRRHVPGDGQEDEKVRDVGDIAATVDPFVVPDQTKPLAPDDKSINAPLLVFAETDVPPIIPAIAIGNHVFASRMIPTETQESQLDIDKAAGEIPHTKANGEKDIGGDGSGSLTYNAILTESQAPQANGAIPQMMVPPKPPDPGTSGVFTNVGQWKGTQTSQSGAPSNAPTGPSEYSSVDIPTSGPGSNQEQGHPPVVGGTSIADARPATAIKGDVHMSGKFKTTPMDKATPPTFDEKEPVAKQDPLRATRHPFRSSAAFRSHGLGTVVPEVMRQRQYDTSRLNKAESELGHYRDASWHRWNEATQGVNSIEMPVSANNFLVRDRMITDYQMAGANDLMSTFSPCPYDGNQILGRFGVKSQRGYSKHRYIRP
jgi:hypothetical protein